MLTFKPNLIAHIAMNTYTPVVRICAVTVAFLLAAWNASVYADSIERKGKAIESTRQARAAALPEASGVVEDIDVAARYLIVKHGPIANLNMDPMTMAFTVEDARLFSKLKVGDTIVFTAKSSGDTPTITSLKIKRSAGKP